MFVFEESIPTNTFSPESIMLYIPIKTYRHPVPIYRDQGLLTRKMLKQVQHDEKITQYE